MRPSSTLALALLAFSPATLAQASPPPRASAQPGPPTSPQSLSIVTVEGAVVVRDRDGVRRAARAGDALTRGAQIAVGSAGYALVALPNGVSLALLPDTRLTAFGNSSGRADARTTLEAGTARVMSPSEGARAFVLSTMSAAVSLGQGDGIVRVLPSARATRVSTHSGSMRARFAGGTFAVSAGRGLVVTVGRGPRTRTLPPAPSWAEAPPGEVATPDAPVDISGSIDATAPTRAQRWRVEVARDEAFREIVSATRVSGVAARWEERALPVGTYFVRAFAIDADQLESAPSAPVRVAVRSAEIDSGEGASRRTASVRVPSGLSCGLDGAPLSASTRSIRLSPARAHRLRCASRPDGSDAIEREIAAEESGPLHHEVRVQQTNWGEGIVTVRLADAEGYGVPYASIAMSSGGALSADPMREGTERGVYRAAIFWRGRFPPPFTLHFTVNGAVRFDAPVTRPEGILAAINR